MIILTTARYKFLLDKVSRQAGVIHELNSQLNDREREIRDLASRVAELETTYQASGLMNEDGSFRDNARDVLTAASIVMEKLEELR